MPGFSCYMFKEADVDWGIKAKIKNCGVCVVFNFETGKCSADEELKIYKEYNMFCPVCQKNTSFITTTKGSMCKECKTVANADTKETSPVPSSKGEDSA